MRRNQVSAATIVILLVAHYGNSTEISCPSSPVQLGATVNVTIDFDVDLSTYDTGSVSIEFYPDGNTGGSIGDLVSCDWTEVSGHETCTFDRTRYSNSFQKHPATLVLTILDVSRNDIGRYKIQMVFPSGNIPTSKDSCFLNVEGFDVVDTSPDAVVTPITTPSPSSESDGGQKAGIGIGVSVALALIAALVLLVCYFKGYWCQGGVCVWGGLTGRTAARTKWSMRKRGDEENPGDTSSSPLNSDPPLPPGPSSQDQHGASDRSTTIGGDQDDEAKEKHGIRKKNDAKNEEGRKRSEIPGKHEEEQPDHTAETAEQLTEKAELLAENAELLEKAEPPQHVTARMIATTRHSKNYRINTSQQE